MKNIAVILAGGVGSRLNAGIPKQFLKVAGMSVIEHTVAAFQHHKKIDEIAIVVTPAYENKIADYVIKNQFTKVKKILYGGPERYDSSLSAIKAYESEGECNIIFHDAVRPLLNSFILDKVILALEDYQAVDVAINTSDTIIEVSEENFIEFIPNRNKLRRGQTPQAFKLSIIAEAYKRALADAEFKTTDDCGVVVKYMPEIKVLVVNGAESNMKLTYKEDLYLLEKLFQLKTVDFQKKTTDRDITALQDKVVVIFGAAYGIGQDIHNILQSRGIQVFAFSRSLNNTDVSKYLDVRKALKQVKQITGKIDCIINTAAILNKEPLINMSYNDIRRATDVNYLGIINIAKESFKYLQESRGHLLFYTSSSYTRGRKDYSIYSSTKCAVVNFVQAIAEEWNLFGIKVNCLNPERTKTPMRIKNFGVEPKGTLLSSEVVARVSIKVLASSITGQVIDVKRENN